MLLLDQKKNFGFKYKLLPVDPQMWLVKGHVIRFKDQMLIGHGHVTDLKIKCEWSKVMWLLWTRIIYQHLGLVQFLVKGKLLILQIPTNKMQVCFIKVYN